MRKEIVIVGQGGQGIVLMGEILAKTAEADGKKIACIPSYGGAARGEKCASEVVVSDKSLDFPGVMQPDILIAMSQEGYTDWISQVSLKTEVFFDIDMVKSILIAKAAHAPIPATGKAIETGARMTANMVMLGAVVAVTKIVSLENLFTIVKKKTGRFADVNLDAIRQGYEFGKRYSMKKRR